MYNWIKKLLLITAMLMSHNLYADTYQFGRQINEEQIQPWNIDIRPDGTGLPTGEATADDGEETYIQYCAMCHGEFGEGVGRFPRLIGTVDELTQERVYKTVGGYWPYATTLWDYVYRAMPFGNAQSLSAQQVYEVVAYILAANGIIESDMAINAQNLASIKMPNRDGFIRAQGSDIHVTPCMQQCNVSTSIKSKAGIASPNANE